MNRRAAALFTAIFFVSFSAFAADKNDLMGRIAAGTGPFKGLAPGDLTEVTAPIAGDYLPCWDASDTSALGKCDVGDWPAPAADVPRGYIDGLIMSRATTTSISVSDGTARDDADSETMELSTSYTKTEASWTVGTAAGCLDGSESSAGSYDNATWYYVYLIKRTDTDVVDVLCGESKTSPTMPTNYTKSRLIGMFYHKDGTDNILDWYQSGDTFFWVNRGGDGTGSVDDSTPATTMTAVAIAVPPVEGVLGRINIYLRGAAETSESCYVQHGNLANPTSLWTGAGSVSAAFDSISLQNGLIMDIMVDSSSQIKYACSTATNARLFIDTVGWTFSRGKE